MPASSSESVSKRIGTMDLPVADSGPWGLNIPILANGGQIYGKMLSSSARGWLQWRLHEVRSKVLYCHSRLRQQCQGEVIVKAF